MSKETKRTIPQGPHRRTLELDRTKANAEERTLELSFSSETPVERWFGFEILDHGSGSVDLSRLRKGAPLLLNHDPNQQIGVIEDARIEAGRGIAKVRFGKSPLASEIFQDVQDGIRRLVSVGYRVLKMQTEKVENGMETLRCTSWWPFEISLVPIPADDSVGTDRAQPQDQLLVEILPMKRNHILLDAAPTAGGGGAAVATPPAPAPAQPQLRSAADLVASEKNRVKEITAIGNQFQMRELADAACAGETTVDEFRAQVLEKMGKIKRVDVNPTIGMSDHEVKTFSLMRGIQSILRTGRLEGLEKEVYDATAKQYRLKDVKEGAILLPEEIVTRDMGTLLLNAMMENVRSGRPSFNRAQNVGTFTAGGATVQTNLGPLIEYLRNETVLGRLGITELGGLVGDLALPVQTGGATAYWVSETGALTDSQATFAQKVITPKRLGASLPYTTQFLAQSSLSAESFLNNELMTALGIELDRAGLLGSGVSGEPLGVANTTGINATVTYSGAAAWTHVVEHETGITVDNAAIGEMAYLLSAATVGKWKTKLRDSVAGADYLIGSNGLVNGYRYERSNQISAANQSFFGVWRQLLRATWAGREVIVDPYALKKSGQIEITMNQMHDYLVRQPLAFNVSTDSAAQ